MDIDREGTQEDKRTKLLDLIDSQDVDLTGLEEEIELTSSSSSSVMKQKEATFPTPPNEVGRTLKHGNLVIPSIQMRVNHTLGLVVQGNPNKLEKITVYIGNVPTREAADTIADYATSLWKQPSGNPVRATRVEFINTVHFHANTYCGDYVSKIREKFPDTMIRIAAQNQQRDIGYASFGLLLITTRAEVIKGFSSVLGANDKLEAPIGLSIGVNQERQTKFATVAWLGINNMFAFSTKSMPKYRLTASL